MKRLSILALAITLFSAGDTLFASGRKHGRKHHGRHARHHKRHERRFEASLHYGYPAYFAPAPVALAQPVVYPWAPVYTYTPVVRPAVYAPMVVPCSSVNFHFGF